MNIIDTDIKDVLVIEPKVFGDDRGFFFESFNKKIFDEAVGYEVNFVQDNHSKSKKNVLRGLHFQKSPKAQGKLVRCVRGEVYDVAVDIRPDSASFGKWFGIRLSAENKKQLWIPEGFAHGFYTLTDDVEFVYKTTDYYSPECERCIKWNDVDLNISWPIPDKVLPELSAKDEKGTPFASNLHNFITV
ncbi:dTDP-4-dehydrorhamnose 3,5-epimerase [Pantoea sp. PNA 03-3]|uniref:dTDP-4-dehydrorhamnose 3,5-epimerase n=1 Tax=Pantoea sp. PNA 03-3 TaxID=2135460 RepID=UPI000D76F3EB|nr:dTDP-4-dehydrorhamnose 3,5-epimerase [Pantoea sp. PNA 03-3]PXV75693.1 dTDP-4-dehydrorhamnose 3,5-epimerase [Pantoea sp. PNA 03-3]